MSRRWERLGALMLDWAGTTVDHGSRAPALVFLEVFSRAGVTITTQQARAPMGRAKRDHIAAILQMPAVAQQWRSVRGGEFSDEDIDRLYNEFLPLQKETLARHSQVIAGVPEAVAECRRQGLKIASSTGYTRELMGVVAPLAAEQGYSPDLVLCAEDASAGRPAPWLMFAAAERLNVYPLWRFVKVDDTVVGVEAGRNAGAWSVGVTRTGNEVGLTAEQLEELDEAERRSRIERAEQRLSAAGAHYVVESVADLPGVLDQIEGRLASGERPG